MTVYGHETLRASLRQYFAPVAVFSGPRGVGKWTVAEQLRVENSIHHSDVLRFHRLDSDAVLALKEFSLTPPAASEFKLAIVELYPGSESQQQALASLLEHPRYLKIIFIAEPSAIDQAISSRAVTYRFKPLRPDDVSSILVSRLGIPLENARSLASVSGGQVSKAVQIDAAEPAIELVRQAVAALRVKDVDALSALSDAWTDEATLWLVEWCHEAVSGQWRAFCEEDQIESVSLPLRILKELSVKVRPRLVVRSQLMRVLKGN